MEHDAEPAGFLHEVTANEAAIDANGHVNNVVFVQWMQDVAIRHWDSLGGMAMQQEAAATWVARSHHIEYLRPARLGDRITIRTWVADIRRVRSRRHYEFLRAADGELLARGETDWVFVDVSTGRPKSVPAAFMERFRGSSPPSPSG